MAKILIVDDDTASRQLYVSLLTPFGHEVKEAVDGKDGLAQARLEKPDIIISDILMPTMNGFEFVSNLRKQPALENIPVIFNSASFLDRETRTLGATCGVIFYLRKPAEPENVLAVVHEALGQKMQKAPEPAQGRNAEEAIPLLLDVVFEKGQQLDATSTRLAVLLELGLDLAHCFSVDALMAKAGNAARKIIGANYSGVGILAERRLELRSFLLAGANLEVDARQVGTLFNGPVFQNIVDFRKPCRCFDAVAELTGLTLPTNHPPVRGFLGVPLEVGTRVYGWIYVANKLASLEFTEEDARILTALAAHVALAFENAERFRTIQEHSEKLEAEIEERRRAEDRFRVLVETAPTGIVIANDQGRITEVNAQALLMFGYDRRELIGELVETLLPERARSSHHGHRTGYMKEPHARPMGVGVELFARRKDGTEFPVEISLGPLVTKDGVLVSSTIVDITKRKEVEEQLRLSQRMEAIGKLSGGVAHDFNNLLAVIMGGADNILDALATDHPLVKTTKMIRQAANSAADLTRQLLAFSRQQMLQPKVLDLMEIVTRTDGMLRRLIGENIKLEMSLEPSLGRVKADPGQVEQILINLAVNARDAMPHGGCLTIEARNVYLDEAYKDERKPVVPGPYVMLAVADSGSGMDRATQQKIFDPFFTTKQLGKGTGLGLATVYGIVKQSGGYIWVYSELDKGTVFKVYFPRIEEKAQPMTQAAPEQPISRGSETILLAEDSESLREMAREYLQSVGYKVLEASSGTEALQKSREFAGTIHLVLTDVVMPEMSGPELARQMESLRPGVKVIFTSGYTDDAIARQGLLDPNIAFIQKPYRPKALARKIREVLNGTGQEIENNAHVVAPV